MAERYQQMTVSLDALLGSRIPSSHEEDKEAPIGNYDFFAQYRALQAELSEIEGYLFKNGLFDELSYEYYSGNLTQQILKLEKELENRRKSDGDLSLDALLALNVEVTPSDLIDRKTVRELIKSNRILSCKVVSGERRGVMYYEVRVAPFDTQVAHSVSRPYSYNPEIVVFTVDGKEFYVQHLYVSAKAALMIQFELLRAKVFGISNDLRERLNTASELKGKPKQ